MIKMTKQRLMEYAKLKKELASIQKRLENDASEYGVDIVHGSSTEHPYTEHSILVSGCGQSRRSRMLTRRRLEIEAEMTEVETYIYNLPISEDRLLMECRYIDRLSWKEVAGELDCSERTVYEIHKDILARLQ